MNIEELAFKNYYELKDIQKVDLLLIIEFLQKDRKQWINQYTQSHNDYVNLQQKNQQLKDRITNAIERLEALIIFWKKYNPIDSTMQVEQFEGVISLLKEDNKEEVDE